jgi:hypothetical protein
MVEMVDDQTVNQAANQLKKGKNKNLIFKQNHQFWSSKITVLFILMPASRPVCVCLFSRFGLFLWQMDGGGSHGPSGGGLKLR